MVRFQWNDSERVIISFAVGFHCYGKIREKMSNLNGGVSRRHFAEFRECSRAEDRKMETIKTWDNAAELCNYRGKTETIDGRARLAEESSYN